MRVVDVRDIDCFLFRMKGISLANDRFTSWWFTGKQNCFWKSVVRRMRDVCMVSISPYAEEKEDFYLLTICTYGFPNPILFGYNLSIN